MQIKNSKKTKQKKHIHHILSVFPVYNKLHNLPISSLWTELLYMGSSQYFQLLSKRPTVSATALCLMLITHCSCCHIHFVYEEEALYWA